MDYELYKDTSSILEALSQVSENTMPVNTKGKSFEELAALMEDTKVKQETVLTEGMEFSQIFDVLVEKSLDTVDTDFKNTINTLCFVLKEQYEDTDKISGELFDRIKSIFNKKLIK